MHKILVNVIMASLAIVPLLMVCYMMTGPQVIILDVHR